MRTDLRFPVSDRFPSLAKAAVCCLTAGLLASSADAQYGYFPDQPEAVEVADLSRRPSFFHEKAVLTRGKLGFSFGTEPTGDAAPRSGIPSPRKS